VRPPRRASDSCPYAAGRGSFLPRHAGASPPPAASPPHPLCRAPPADLPVRRPHLQALRGHTTRRRRRPPLHHRPGHPGSPAASLQAPPPRSSRLSAPARPLVSAVRGSRLAPRPDDGARNGSTLSSGEHSFRAPPAFERPPRRRPDDPVRTRLPPRKPRLFFLGSCRTPRPRLLKRGDLPSSSPPLIGGQTPAVAGRAGQSQHPHAAHGLSAEGASSRCCARHPTL
jgi:hypothetical protein